MDAFRLQACAQPLPVIFYTFRLRFSASLMAAGDFSLQWWYQMAVVCGLITCLKIQTCHKECV